MLFGKEGWLGLLGTVLKLFYASSLLSLAWEIIRGELCILTTNSMDATMQHSQWHSRHRRTIKVVTLSLDRSPIPNESCLKHDFGSQLEFINCKEKIHIIKESSTCSYNHRVTCKLFLSFDKVIKFPEFYLLWNS